MFPILFKYLVFRQQLSIASIGVFVLEREQARLDMSDKLIHAPVSVVKFSPEHIEAGQDLYDFIAHELHTNVDEAIKSYEDFAYDLKLEVQNKKWVELPGMGVLTQGVRDEIKFKSTAVLREYYPAVKAERVLSNEDGNVGSVSATTSPTYLVENVEEESLQQKKDYWWVYAVILALIGAGAIFYYYYYKPK